MSADRSGADDAAQPAWMVGWSAVLDDVEALLPGQARCERKHAGGHGVVAGADQQAVKPTETDELAELPTAFVRD